DLQPARGAVGEWAFVLDPGVQVTDVEVNNRAGWRVDPATRQLRVTLRQPGSGGKIKVSVVAPLPSRGVAAALPTVRPIGAVVGEERIDIRIHPDVRLDSWDAGDYRLTDSSVGPDQVRTLTLVGSLLPIGAILPFRQMPEVRTTGSDTEFVTAEG